MSGPATDGAGKEKDIMICTVIQGRDFDGIEELLGRCEMAEIRLDGCRLSVPEISRCFSSDVPLVATCRLALFRKERPELDEVSALKECGRRLIAAIEAGAAYVDIEEEAPVSMVRRVCRAAAENGTVVIRSYHDFDKTGSVEELRSVVEKCRRDGADIVKIATMAQSQDDVARVMSMYDDAEPGTLLAFCMGEDGRESRIECLRRGAPFSYASVSVEECAAPGQWTAAEMSERVYGDFRWPLPTACRPCLDILPAETARPQSMQSPGLERRWCVVMMCLRYRVFRRLRTASLQRRFMWASPGS